MSLWQPNLSMIFILVLWSLQKYLSLQNHRHLVHRSFAIYNSERQKFSVNYQLEGLILQLFKVNYRDGQM